MNDRVCLRLFFYFVDFGGSAKRSRFWWLCRGRTAAFGRRLLLPPATTRRGRLASPSTRSKATTNSSTRSVCWPFFAYFFSRVKICFFYRTSTRGLETFLLRTSMIDDRFLSILGIPDVYLFAVTFCVT